MALNWWNFQAYNTSLIWVLKTDGENLPKISPQEYQKCRNYQIFLERTSKRQGVLKQLWERYNLNQQDSQSCITRPSRFFYLPQKFAKNFAMIGSAAVVNRLTQDMGVPNVLQTLTDLNGYQYLSESYVLPRRRSKSSPELWSVYTSAMMVAHPYKLYNRDKKIWDENKQMLQRHYRTASHRYTQC